MFNEVAGEVGMGALPIGLLTSIGSSINNGLTNAGLTKGFGGKVATIADQVANAANTVKGHSTRDTLLNNFVPLSSQIVSAFGKNATQQLGLPANNLVPQYYGSPDQLADAPGSRAANSFGEGIRTTLDSIGAMFGISGTTVAVLGVGGAVLLFMRPPRKGRG